MTVRSHLLRLVTAVAVVSPAMSFSALPKPFFGSRALASTACAASASSIGQQTGSKMQSRSSVVSMPLMALGKRSTAKEVIDAFSPNLKGKTAVVTGGNSGIGTETVKALASAGCRVILCSRNVQAGEEAAEVQIKASQGREIKDGYSVPDADIKVLPLDLADLASVEQLAKELESEESIDYLVLNAGVMIGPKGYTKDGFERQIGTNHFGHFYLTDLLLPRMKQQETPSR
jgi:hypothetical protein